MDLATPKHKLQIHITPTGKVRIFGKKEWKELK
jgi:hypothetical protein